MNTSHQSSWALSLGALVLTLTVACGSEAPVAPADIGGAEPDTSSDNTGGDNTNRLDFRDNGLG
jgi:hypothetical protein